MRATTWLIRRPHAGARLGATMWPAPGRRAGRRVRQADDGQMRGSPPATVAQRSERWGTFFSTIRKRVYLPTKPRPRHVDPEDRPAAQPLLELAHAHEPADDVDRDPLARAALAGAIDGHPRLPGRADAQQGDARARALDAPAQADDRKRRQQPRPGERLRAGAATGSRARGARAAGQGVDGRVGLVVVAGGRAAEVRREVDPAVAVVVATVRAREIGSLERIGGAAAIAVGLMVEGPVGVVVTAVVALRRVELVAVVRARAAEVPPAPVDTAVAVVVDAVAAFPGIGLAVVVGRMQPGSAG